MRGVKTYKVFASVSSTQVSLVPPPWLELTTSEPSLSATRVSPPGTTRTPSEPDSTKGRRSTWRGATPPRKEVGTGGQRQGRLGDEIIGMGQQLLPEDLDLLLGGVRSDQHAIAAGAVDLLDHQFGQMVEHIFESVGLAAAPGGDILSRGSSPR